MSAQPIDAQTQKRLSFLIRILFWAGILLLIWIAGRLLLSVLLPFVLAFLSAAALQRPIRFLKRRVTPGFASIVVSVPALLTAGGGITALTFFGGRFLLGLLKKEETLSALQNCFAQLKHTFSALGQQMAAALPRELANTAQEVEQSILQKAAEWLASVAGGVLSFAVDGLPQVLIALLFFVPAFVFFARDYDAVVAFLYRQLPEKRRPLVKAAVLAVCETTVCTIKAYVWLGLLTFILTAIGFFILHIPYPLLLGALTALVDALPVLGVGTVLLPMAIFHFVSGDTFTGVGLLLLYAVITAARNLLQPRLISHETGLPPLVTLVVMYGGWQLAGLCGLLGAPIAAMVVLRLQREGYLRAFL